MDSFDDIMASLFGGGGPEVAAPPPPDPTDPAAAAGRPARRSFGGAAKAPPTPEEIAQVTQFLEAAGVPPEGVPVILAMDEKQQNDVIKALATRKPTAATAPKTPFDRKPLVDAYGEEYAGMINSAPENALSSITSALASSKIKGGAGGKTATIDREKIAQQYPQLAPYIGGMTDADVSEIMSGAFEASQQGGKQQYEDDPDRGGLKIVQDAAFQRTGLKSGDTVCIKIP